MGEWIYRFVWIYISETELCKGLFPNDEVLKGLPQAFVLTVMNLLNMGNAVNGMKITATFNSA
jgi:hypothetical protein